MQRAIPMPVEVLESNGVFRTNLKIKHFTLGVSLSLFACALALWLGYLSMRPYHFHLPVKFTDKNIPYIEAWIEGKKYHLVVDLGSKFQLCLTPDVLKQLHKYQCGSATWMNVKGEQYTFPQYIIPKIKIGPSLFKNPLAVEKPLTTRCILWETKQPESFIPDGYLGKNLLKEKNLLFDLSHSRILASNSPKKLLKDGYDINHYIKIPLEITDKSVIISVITEYGLIKLVLDTGSTGTLLRDALVNNNTHQIHGIPHTYLDQFVIGDHNFGKQSAYLFEIPEAITSSGIDGVLGVDFFIKHNIYIDFSTSTAYISQ